MENLEKMENLEMDDMKEITKEMAIKAAAAAMTNYFSDLYLKDKEFAMTFEELKLIALGMYCVSCYFNENLIHSFGNEEESKFIVCAILDMSTDLVGLLYNLNPEKFCEDHFKGFKEVKEGKEKMDLKA